jgi:hypothetical protein
VSVLTHGFGEGSNNLRQFYFARSAGDHYIGGMHPSLIQSNFNQRIEKFNSVLESSMTELEMMMPEPEIAGAYDTADEYRFYKDLKTIVGFAGKELLVIDNYLDTQLFDVYMDNVGPSVQIRVLTRQISDSLKLVAEKFVKRGGFELRASNGVH